MQRAAFGRVEEPPPRLARVPLAAIVAEIIDGERLAAGDADISFSEDIPGGLVVRADGEQLYRVILNLVRNARQAIAASGRPGEIGIAAEEDDEASDHNGGMVGIEVDGVEHPPAETSFFRDVLRGAVEEQRATDWMRFQSLPDFLDPADHSRTVEGLPAPTRAVLLARKP